MPGEADIREFNLPETKHGEKGVMVDFNAAAAAIGCDKVMLTKSHMPEMIAYARSHGKKAKK